MFFMFCKMTFKDKKKSLSQFTQKAHEPYFGCTICDKNKILHKNLVVTLPTADYSMIE